ncbi:MAG: hypothetical protein Q4G58_07345 [bacterium]|nr:hypothetical protein [bacterium]
MAKAKRPEMKVMYDMASLFIILFFLKEMAQALSPYWKEGIFCLKMGCYGCGACMMGIFLYLFVYLDHNARKLREMFYYYKLEGLNGYPKYKGKSVVNYRWLYGKELASIEEKSKEDKATLVSPFDESDSIDSFYKNNNSIIKYRFSLPEGLTVSEIGKKLEGMVQHLERDAIIIYENGSIYIIVGDPIKKKFLQKI